jgi:hypothetical protein
MWADEVLGWTLLTDPSFRHMIHAWREGADGGGLPFYLLGRAWFRFFGSSTISFRLFSSTAFAAAFVITWKGLRHFYSGSVVAVAMYISWMCSWTILRESSEGRFYGLLLLAASAVFYTYARTITTTKVSVALLVAVFCSHAFLVSSHVLGIVYSGVFFAATIISDWRSRIRRTALYLSQVLAWLVVIPSWHAIKSTTDIGKPYFWLGPPEMKDLLLVWVLNNPLVLLFSLTLGVLIYKGRKNQTQVSDTSREVWHLIFTLLAVAPVFFISSFLLKPIFLDRYLIPTAIGLVLLIAELFARSGLLSGRYKFVPQNSKVFVGVTLIPIVLLLGVSHLKQERNPALEEALRLDKSIPVVCDSARDFEEMLTTQSGSGSNFVYILDWPTVLDPKSPRSEVTDYHLMEKWKTLGYHSGSIFQSDDFLRQTPAFYLFSAQGEQWMADKVQDRKDFSRRQIGTLYGHKHLITIWEVRRKV